MTTGDGYSCLQTPTCSVMMNNVTNIYLVIKFWPTHNLCGTHNLSWMQFHVTVWTCVHVDSCDNSMMNIETEIPLIKFNFCRKFIEGEYIMWKLCLLHACIRFLVGNVGTLLLWMCVTPEMEMEVCNYEPYTSSCIVFPIEWSYVVCLKTIYVPLAFIVHTSIDWEYNTVSLSKFLANCTLKQFMIVCSSEEESCQWIWNSKKGALALYVSKYGIL